MAEVIIVRNTGTSDLDVRFNSRSTIIKPDESGIVETDAAKLWFGDWDARNMGREERHQFRTHELARLRGIYGAHFDDDFRTEHPSIPEPLLADQKWERNRPHVELFEQDGTRIISVLDDPEGKTLPLEEASHDVLARTVEDMQAQLAQMQEQLAKAQEAQDTLSVPTDSPDTSPQRKRGAVKVDAAIDREDVG